MKLEQQSAGSVAAAHVKYARVLLEKGMREEAADALKAALQVLPDFAEARQMLGVLFKATGDADGLFRGCLAAWQAAPDDPAKMGRIEALLVSRMEQEQTAALYRDVARLGMEGPLSAAAVSPSAAGEISSQVLLEAAEAFADHRRYALTHMVCRYLNDHGFSDQRLFKLIARMADGIGAKAFALRYQALAEGKQAGELENLTAPEPEGSRFHLIKAWGFGFWSDIDHLLGQLLLAEITNRIPVIHWGANSLFNDRGGEDGFREFFEPVNDISVGRLMDDRLNFFPSKWNSRNVLEEDLDKWQGPDSRLAALYFLHRGEEVTVSDFHNALADILPWVPPWHPLHGAEPMAAYRHMARKYLRLRQPLQARIAAYRHRHLNHSPLLAVHVRGSDKGKEEGNLAAINTLYHREIELLFLRHPQLEIFLLTDSEPVLAEYRERYGARLLYCPCSRTGSDVGIHYQKGHDRFRLGFEVLRDATLAAGCDFFLGNGSSNVSCAVAYLKDWPEGTMRLLGANMLLQYRFGFCNH